MDNSKLKFNIRHADQFGNNYNEIEFWSKMRRLVGIAGHKIVYNALLLYYVLTSHNVPVKYKSAIIGALGYLILPTDFIPDFLVGIGYTDDLTALLAVVKMVADCITPEIETAAEEKTNELFGTSINKK